jgi:hypothetical protein
MGEEETTERAPLTDEELRETYPQLDELLDGSFDRIERLAQALAIGLSHTFMHETEDGGLMVEAAKVRELQVRLAVHTAKVDILSTYVKIASGITDKQLDNLTALVSEHMRSATAEALTLLAAEASDDA